MPTPPLPDSVLIEAVEAYHKIGSKSAAARYLGIPENTMRHRLRLAENRGIGTINQQIETAHGNNPEYDLTHKVPAPLILRGTSTLYDKDGALKLQWVKSTKSDELLNSMIEAMIKTLSKEFEGKSPLVKAPKAKQSSLLCSYIMGDPHFGMYAWYKEAGDDFDVAIAKNITTSAVDRLVLSAPDSETAILLSVGDTLHADNQSNTTTAGTGVDTDTRFARVLEITIDTFRHMIVRLLGKHKKVVVRLMRGNHDTHSHLSLAFALKGYFSNNKRVEIDICPSDFWYYRFGKVLIGSTHGDKTKQEQLLGIMVSDRPQDVGETKHRYFYTGHIHHQVVKEFAGLICESFQTLAPKDAWHAGKGYRSGRSMMCIVHHKEHGEIERHRCDIGMVDGK